MTRIPFYSGLSELSRCYDAYLLDSWGVLQDGVTAFEAANECLRQLKKRGKKLLILSNSARRSSVVAGELAALGIAMDCIDVVLTGGEAAWRSLKHPSDGASKALGDKCYYLGSARSRSLLDGLDLQVTTSIEDATFILNTSPPDNLNDDALTRLLKRAKERDLALVCANPDLVAYHGAEKRICAGTIAARYAALGAAVHYHGKPHAPFYRQALEILEHHSEKCTRFSDKMMRQNKRLEHKCDSVLSHVALKPVERGRILAVGDSLSTDIAGAVNAGIDALFVTSGIHRHEFTGPEHLTKLSCNANTRPIGAVERFSW